MSVGGFILEMKRFEGLDGDPEQQRPMVRIVVDIGRKGGPPERHNIYVEPFVPEHGPKVGDEIWWQGRLVYYDGDAQALVRI